MFFFLEAILYYIFTVGGIIEREHIPPKRPKAWSPSWHPQEPRLFNYHPSRGPSRTLRQQTTKNHCHGSSTTQRTKVLKPPPHLHMQVLRMQTHTDRCTREHKHWKHTLLTGTQLSADCFGLFWFLIGLCGLWERPIYWIWRFSS